MIRENTNTLASGIHWIIREILLGMSCPAYSMCLKWKRLKESRLILDLDKLHSAKFMASPFHYSLTMLCAVFTKLHIIHIFTSVPGFVQFFSRSYRTVSTACSNMWPLVFKSKLPSSGIIFQPSFPNLLLLIRKETVSPFFSICVCAGSSAYEDNV